jgi:hypothetical protein
MCPDCGQGFFVLKKTPARCLVCALERNRQRNLATAAAWQREYGPRREDPEQRRARRQHWRAANLDKAREDERRRGRKKREVNPEAYRAASLRYRQSTAFVERQLAEQAMRAALREIRQAAVREMVLERQATVRELRMSPRLCVFCGDLFVPSAATRRPQIYCGAKCNNRAQRLSTKIGKAAAAGRLGGYAYLIEKLDQTVADIVKPYERSGFPQLA